MLLTVNTAAVKRSTAQRKLVCFRNIFTIHSTNKHRKAHNETAESERQRKTGKSTYIDWFVEGECDRQRVHIQGPASYRWRCDISGHVLCL